MTTATLTNSPSELIGSKTRISTIDMMRGIVMVIMALDHARDFFHQGAFVYNPTDMQTTTPVLFFTRWITHFCAPTFVFLAGTSIFISAGRKSKKDLSLFLLTRGLWLILLEVVVIRFSFFFNFYYDVTVLQVIWAIGASMVCMSLLTRLPYKAVLIIGLAIVGFHNVADAFPVRPDDQFYAVWAILRQSGFITINENAGIISFYPIIPWLGIMMLGYCFGKLYTDFDSATRKRLLLRLGIIAIAAFIIIRFINIYGDPAPWAAQKNGVFTIMSFLNCTKYPPSLLYTLMTLGPVCVILSFAENFRIGSLNPFVVLGRVPLFFYILHFFLIHAAALLLFMQKTNTPFEKLDLHFNKSFGGITPEGGYSLGWVYVAWIAVVLALYPLCYWYNQYKGTHKHWWLSYL